MDREEKALLYHLHSLSRSIKELESQAPHEAIKALAEKQRQILKDSFGPSPFSQAISKIKDVPGLPTSAHDSWKSMLQTFQALWITLEPQMSRAIIDLKANTKDQPLPTWLLDDLSHFLDPLFPRPRKASEIFVPSHWHYGEDPLFHPSGIEKEQKKPEPF